MDIPDIPEDYIYHYGLRAVGDYFAQWFMDTRASGKVGILVKEFTWSFFFTECDNHGYPQRRYTDYLTFMDNPKIMDIGADPMLDEIKVYKKTIEVDKPIIVYDFRPNFYPESPYVFLWEGRVVNKEEVPIEKLDVKQLLKLAQEAVRNREGLILDEVLKNKLIK